MLLESSLLIINIFNKNIYLLISILIFLLIFNFYKDKEFFYKIKKMDKFILIYLFYLIIYRRGAKALNMILQEDLASLRLCGLKRGAKIWKIS